MKKLILSTIIIASTSSLFAQVFKKTTYSATEYAIMDSVKITTGHGDTVNSFVVCVVPMKIWDDAVKAKEMSDEKYLSHAVNMVAIAAQFTLKTPASFEARRNQFISWMDKKGFTSAFKMMGRNGYGNMTETVAFVSWNPAK